jgi:uncharacterized membrane protein YcaP (DUF421 family)
MTAFGAADWAGVFIPDASLVESFVRGSVVYLSIIVLFRVVMRRQGGSIGLPDIMLVVLVSECVSVALSAEAKSVPNGLAAVSALLFWSFVLDRLGHRWPWFQRLLEPEPLPLVRDGKPLRDNLDSEGITDEELEAQLRLNGVENVSKVKLATLEADGDVSVVPKARGGDESREPAACSSCRSDASDLEGAARHFEEAAEQLRAAVARHEEQAADHKAAAKAARELLARHGARPGKFVTPRKKHSPAVEKPR